MIKKPYIKKFGEISMFKIFLVDGNYIRKNIDEEFTNFGQHYRFKFIPRDEFWIDKEHSKPGEEKYYIDHMLKENQLMSSGKKYDRAIEEADRLEIKERDKRKIIKKLKNIRKNKHQIWIKRIHKNLLQKYGKRIKVWVVHGGLVRDLFFVDFTEGGHDKVYGFVPKNEIWIDDDLSMRERKFVLLHEAHERALMCKGFNYDRAHKSSSEIEHFYRHNPRGIDLQIKKELKKSKVY